MCGIVGVLSSAGSAAPDIYAGLWSLQHRGKESTGIVTWNGSDYEETRKMGTVDAAMSHNALEAHTGFIGIGHVRYSTTGSSEAANIQPVEGVFRGKRFWVAHNGNLVNTNGLRNRLAQEGYTFRTNTDTELIVALIATTSRASFEEALREAIASVEGTFSLVVLFQNKIYGARDATGNRPLVIGAGRGITVLASESAACDVLGVPVLRDIGAGEMVVLDGEFHNWYQLVRGDHEERMCIFEFVYFLRPDSRFGGIRAQRARERMGRTLAKEHPADADVVVPVPDSGNFAAFGYAAGSGIPLELGLFRSHYVGRTFIEPLQRRRTRGLRIKLNPIPEIMAGRRVVLVDDSIVRATVMRGVISMVRDVGAREVHVRISSPPYHYPCYYGIDTNKIQDELIASRCGGDIDRIRREIGADSLGYLSLDGLKGAITENGSAQFCDACFSGTYHIPVTSP